MLDVTQNLGQVRITVTHDGTDYAGEVMTVGSTRLGWEDHGILTASIDCRSSYGGVGGVGVGGYALDAPLKRGESGTERVGTAYGLDHVMQLMRVVGVEKWEDMPGRRVIVLSTGSGGPGSMSKGLANIDSGRVFLLSEHATAWKDAAQ